MIRVSRDPSAWEVASLVGLVQMNMLSDTNTVSTSAHCQELAVSRRVFVSEQLPLCHAE